MLFLLSKLFTKEVIRNRTECDNKNKLFFRYWLWSYIIGVKIDCNKMACKNLYARRIQIRCQKCLKVETEEKKWQIEK